MTEDMIDRLNRMKEDTEEMKESLAELERLVNLSPLTEVPWEDDDEDGGSD